VAQGGDLGVQRGGVVAAFGSPAVQVGLVVIQDRGPGDGPAWAERRAVLRSTPSSRAIARRRRPPQASRRSHIAHGADPQLTGPIQQDRSVEDRQGADVLRPALARLQHQPVE
jgi:hypothetical protein